MTRNNVFVGDRRVLRRYIGDKLIFDDLDNKTEILSGTEIYTDKADDSVVHVEVDGKSYQDAGGGKNLLIGYNRETLEVFNDSTAERYIYPSKSVIKLKPNTTYTLSGEFRVDVATSRTLDLFLVHSGGTQHRSRTNIPLSTSWVKHHAVLTTGDGTEMLMNPRFDLNGLSTPDSVTMYARSIQLEEGSSLTDFEPPAPSPDYPIEIHSLNDFDVVSSVGRENLALNSNNGWMSSVYKIMDGTLSEDWVVGETYTITIKGEVNAGNVFGIWRDDGGVRIHGSSVYNPETKTHSLTAVIPMPAVNAKIHNVFSIYNVLSANATSANIEWVKIEKGSFSTPYSLAPKDILESDNHQLIDKINLLLDEPLRSVGDVKDRLFRDSDGLWKVERNIGEYTFTGDETFVLFENTRTNTQSYTIHPAGLPALNQLVDFSTSDAPNNVISNRFKLSKETSGDDDFMTVYSIGSNKWVWFNISRNRLTEQNLAGFKNWLKQNSTTITYRIIPNIKILSQPLQDKLNNLRTFKDSNYIYTVMPDKSNILQENLKSTLYATFKSIGWETFRKKVEQGGIT